MFIVPEAFRVTRGEMASDDSYGNNGVFFIPVPEFKTNFACQASDGMMWEHVSIRIHPQKRTPVWAEMNYIKDLFWGDDDLVVQYHPPKKDYINNHPYVLHLWRPVGTIIPAPPSILVGI